VGGESSSSRWVVAGLGNPGPSYAGTRHNVGFRAVELLARRWGVPLREKDGLAWGSAENGGITAYLAFPLTFMNRSGEPLAPFVQYRNIPLDHVLVVVDDLDLPPGRLRLRASGTSGGHHGLDSLIACLGTEGFPRIRIGVGKPPSPGLGADWVLSGFPPEDRPRVEASLEAAADGVEMVLEKGIGTAQAFLNGWAPQEPNGPG